MTRFGDRWHKIGTMRRSQFDRSFDRMFSARPVHEVIRESGALLDHEHPETTRRNHHRYLFTAKHHGGHGDAQWLPSLSEVDEFSVFDDADEMDLADGEGNLFGGLRDGADSLRVLGYYQEQIAEFPCSAEGSPWHGYPVWAINQSGATNRRTNKQRPAKAVFDRMVEVGLITQQMRRRLMKGDHV